MRGNIKRWPRIKRRVNKNGETNDPFYPLASGSIAFHGTPFVELIDDSREQQFLVCTYENSRTNRPSRLAVPKILSTATLSPIQRIPIPSSLFPLLSTPPVSFTFFFCWCLVGLRAILFFHAPGSFSFCSAFFKLSAFLFLRYGAMGAPCSWRGSSIIALLPASNRRVYFCILFPCQVIYACFMQICLSD